MNDHKYILEPYRGGASRHACPKCGQLRCFSRYIDNDTTNYLHSGVGRCNREDKCGYHYTPKQYFEDNPNSNSCSDVKVQSRVNEREVEIGRIPKEYIIKSVGYDSNFVAFLCSLFDRFTIESPTVERLMNDYYLGQTKNRSIIFWQIDTNNRIRTGKIMQYSPITGRRIKNASGAIDWVHNKLKRDQVLPDNFNLSQCFFGEHLLKKHPSKTICIVESEKSALIASGVMPEYIWLATGGKQNLKADKCQILQGRKVILSPDLGAFDDWSAKASGISKTVSCRINVSTLLEDIATEQDRAEGLDVADYLIRELLTSTYTPTISFSGEEQNIHHLEVINPNIRNLINALDLVGMTGQPLRLHVN